MAEPRTIDSFEVTPKAQSEPAFLAREERLQEGL